MKPNSKEKLKLKSPKTLSQKLWQLKSSTTKKLVKLGIKQAKIGKIHKNPIDLNLY